MRYLSAVDSAAKLLKVSGTCTGFLVKVAPMAPRIPAYRLRKSRNCAVVTIDGHDYYLGPYGSVESRQKYGELIAKHAAGLSLEIPEEPLKFVSVAEVVLAFMSHARTHYVKNGKLTDEYGCLRSASNPLVELYGETDAAKFNGPALKAVRQRMIELGWSRRYINKSVGRIRLIFRRAVADDLIGPEVIAKLETVEPLLEGRTNAVELPKRSAVPPERIAAVRQDVNDHTRDLIDLALLTGARPGELCDLTGAMLDRSHDIWTASIADHKMSHLHKSRVIAFGPRSQVILAKYLKANSRERLFPINRKTFSENIRASCLRLQIPVFTGHWLRHNAATELRREIGLDGAQAVLGHSDSKTTEIYAHLDHSQIIEIARKRG